MPHNSTWHSKNLRSWAICPRCHNPFDGAACPQCADSTDAVQRLIRHERTGPGPLAARRRDALSSLGAVGFVPLLGLLGTLVVLAFWLS